MVAEMLSAIRLGRATKRCDITPVRAALSGCAAGAGGTLAMDGLWFARFRLSGGSGGFWRWEFPPGLDDWGNAPAPALVGKRIVEGLFEREIPSRRAGLVNDLTHWSYGMLGGMQYGVVVCSLPRAKVWYGLPFGAAIWSLSYVILPIAHIYKPVWEYDARTLAKDLSAHLLYGTVTAAALQQLVSPA
jgi:hypothetical protein